MIYLTLFLEFFKVGLFCFGGAFGMIPMIGETVLRHGWLAASEFYSFIGVCESTPGPIAVNMATYVGASQGGLLGSIVATLGVVMPSFLIILLVAAVLKNLTGNRFVRAFLMGVKPVIMALILASGTILFCRSLGYVAPVSFSLQSVSAIVFALLLLAGLGAKLLFKRRIPSVFLIALSAVLGIAVSLAAELVSA